jgi:hypothetical protein
MKFWVKLSLAVVGLAILLSIGLWRYFTWINQRDAERFIAGARTLVIGKSTAADVEKLVKSASRWADPFMDCSPSGSGDCGGIVTFTNFSPFRWPYRIHLARPMGLRCTVYTVRGKLQALLCYMSPGEIDYMDAFVQEGDGPAYCATELNPENKFFKIRQVPTGHFGVCINGQTPPELRDLAFKFDFGCFSRLRGCATYEEMLPVLSRKDLY